MATIAQFLANCKYCTPTTLVSLGDDDVSILHFLLEVLLSYPLCFRQVFVLKLFTFLKQFNAFIINLESLILHDLHLLSIPIPS